MNNPTFAPLPKVPEQFPAWCEFPLLSPRFEEIRAFPAGSNPFQHDYNRMGVPVGFGDGRKYTIMHDSDLNNLIVFDSVSGRRFKLTFVDKVWTEDFQTLIVQIRNRYGPETSIEYQEKFEAQRDAQLKMKNLDTCLKQAAKNAADGSGIHSTETLIGIIGESTIEIDYEGQYVCDVATIVANSYELDRAKFAEDVVGYMRKEVYDALVQSVEIVKDGTILFKLK